jgi:membrane fusion protein
MLAAPNASCFHAVMKAADTSLFREQALISTRQRWFGPVRVVMPPSALFTLVAACTVITMLGAAVASIEIPDRVRSYGVLLPAEGLLKVKAPRSGRVERLRVADGDNVISGQVLLRLSGSQRAPGREPELAARIASLGRELRLLDEAAARRAELADSRERLNRRRLQLTEKRIAAALGEAQSREEQTAIVTARADRIAGLAVANAIAKDAAMDIEADVLLSRAASLAATQRALALQDERLMIRQQLAEERDRADAMRRESGIRREALLRQIAASELLSALQVTAPAGGMVSGLTVRAGEDVAAGDVLMTVYALEARLEARLFLSPDNAGMIAVGQRVELQLRAYPHQFFGTRGAVVTAISTVALPPDEIDAELPVNGSVFVVRARLTQTRMQASGRNWPLPPGTTFQADLVRGRWPLYRWLLRSLTGDPAWS